MQNVGVMGSPPAEAKPAELSKPAPKIDPDPMAAIADLFDRVTALETQLYALQRATAHITSIQPIKG